MKNIARFTLAVFVFSLLAFAAEKTQLHQGWHLMVQKYVKVGKVNYMGIGRDLEQLDNYLQVLQNTNLLSFNRQQKLAFWINAYNAFTIKLILNNYPIKSIRKLSRPWKRRVWKVAGQTLSLDDIEHKILRKKLKEPRIHFAIVCASIGCPDLQSYAFTAEQLEKQLDDAARKFFNSKKHFHLVSDKQTVKLHISKIFRWFGEDFGKNREERVQFILPFLDKSDRETIKKASSLKWKYLSYDWNLNE